MISTNSLHRRWSPAGTHSWRQIVCLTSILLLGYRLAGLAATIEVEIGDLSFIPDQIAVNVGDQVDWVAQTPEHTVTADDGAFDSNLFWDTVPQGERFSFTFDEPGVFRYYCGIHGGPGGAGMAGIVVVSELTENQPPATPINLAPSAGALNQSLTPQLRSSAFADPDPNDFHAASHWIVRAAADGRMVFDSGEDRAQKLQREVPTGRLAEFTTYTWQVRHRDGRGEWGNYSPATSFQTLRAVAANGIGLKTSYWNAPGSAEPLAMATNATVNFTWGSERPHRRITADTFVIRWEGAVLPQFSERYEFEVQARGQVRVWIQGEWVIDDFSVCSFTKSRKAWITLVGGLPVPLRIEYLADASGALAVLRWTSPSQPSEVVPSSRLFPSLP